MSVLSNLIAIMGRTAAYRGTTVTWDELIKSQERLEARLGGTESLMRH